MNKHLYISIIILIFFTGKLLALPLPKGFETISLGTGWDSFTKNHPQAKKFSVMMNMEPDVSNNNIRNPVQKNGILRESFRGMDFFDRGDFSFTGGKLIGMTFSNQDTKLPVNREAYFTMLIRLYGKPDVSGILNNPQRDCVFLMWNLPEARVLGISFLKGKNGQTALQIISPELIQKIGKQEIRTDPRTPEEKADANAIGNLISNVGTPKISSPTPDNSTPIPGRKTPGLATQSASKRSPPITPKIEPQSQPSFNVPLVVGILLLLAVAGFVFYRRKP